VGGNKRHFNSDSQEEAIAKLVAYSTKEYGLGTYTFEKFVYVKSNIKSDVYCTIHNCYFPISSNKFLGGRVGCKECVKEKKSKARRKDQSGAIAEMVAFSTKEYGFNVYTFEKFVYMNTHKTSLIYCTIHKCYFKSTHANFLNKKIGCKDCEFIKRSKAKRRPWEDIKEELDNYVNENYDSGSITFETSVYKGYHAPIEALCNIHDNYFDSTSPANFLQGFVGCSECFSTGFDPSKPAYLYIYKVGKYWKFGITNRKPKARMGQACGAGNGEMIYTLYSKDGKLIQELEKAIKKSRRLITNQAQRDGKKFDGYTETVKATVKNLNVIRQIIKGFLGKAGLAEASPV